jgi:hypothetical protein
MPGRAKHRRGPGALTVALAVLGVVALLGGVIGTGILLAGRDDPTPAPRPVAKPAAEPSTGAGPATDPGADAPATPQGQDTGLPDDQTGTGDPGGVRTDSTAGFEFECPVAWRDETDSPQVVELELDPGERLDAALAAPPTRRAGTGIVISSIVANSATDAGRDDAERLGELGVEVLEENPVVTSVSEPVHVTLDGQPSVQIDFRASVDGESLAGRELLTVRDGRLWRVLLQGTSAEFGANAADLRGILDSWSWR